MMKLLLSAAGLAMAPTFALAQDSAHPAIPRYGRIVPAPDAAMQPDPTLHYRVAFSVTKAASKPSEVNPSLDKMARFLNLLAAGKVVPERGNIVGVVHGAATDLVLDNRAYRAKHGVDNPNLPLIQALQGRGVEVHVCSQALEGRSIKRSDVSTSVIVDLAALTTLTTLQLKGWSVMTD